MLIVGRLVRHVRRRPVDRDDPQPAAEHPRRPLLPDRPRDLLEQEPDRCRAELAAAPRQRRDVRRLPPPPAARVHPAARVQLLPCQQVTGAPLMVQAVGQLGHHLPVPAVPAPEQPQGQHEIHHQPRRQQPSPLLPGPGRVHRRIHQLRRENPGQDTDRDPVRQPAVRRQPFRTIMRHETVTIPLETLRQGHWAGALSERNEQPVNNRLQFTRIDYLACVTAISVPQLSYAPSGTSPGRSGASRRSADQ